MCPNMYSLCSKICFIVLSNFMFQNMLQTYIQLYTAHEYFLILYSLIFSSTASFDIIMWNVPKRGENHNTHSMRVPFYFLRDAHLWLVGTLSLSRFFFSVQKMPRNQDFEFFSLIKINIYAVWPKYLLAISQKLTVSFKF